MISRVLFRNARSAPPGWQRRATFKTIEAIPADEAVDNLRFRLAGRSEWRGDRGCRRVYATARPVAECSFAGGRRKTTLTRGKFVPGNRAIRGQPYCRRWPLSAIPRRAILFCFRARKWFIPPAARNADVLMVHRHLRREPKSTIPSSADRPPVLARSRLAPAAARSPVNSISHMLGIKCFRQGRRGPMFRLFRVRQRLGSYRHHYRRVSDGVPDPELERDSASIRTKNLRRVHSADSNARWLCRYRSVDGG